MAAPPTGWAPTSDQTANRLRQALAAEPDLIPRGTRVVVAVSGGGDSTALLHLLVDISAAHDLELHVAHFDHGVHPRSAAVAEQTGRLAAALGLPFHSERAVKALSGQAAYREARYDFLRRTADRVGATRIALGHQADDQVETVLLALTRGTGLRGLRGMPRRRGRFVRPLLDLDRARLRAQLELRGVEWREDPANTDPRYARTRLREAVLPLLTGVGEPTSLLGALAGHADRADRGLDARTARRAAVAVDRDPHDSGAGGVQIARSRLADYDRAAIARLMRMLARDMGFRLTKGGTAAAVEFIRRGSSGRRVDLGGGLGLAREFETFRLAPAGPDSVDVDVAIAGTSSGAGTVNLGGRVYAVSWGGERSTGVLSVDLDPERIRFPLRVRGTRPGDRIRTPAGSRKVKKVLNEQRVPVSRRRRVPVLECADGRILWIAGHRVAAGARPMSDRTPAFTVEIEQSVTR